MSLRDEVAKRVRVKLARQRATPISAESFGSIGNMQRAKANPFFRQGDIPFRTPLQSAVGSNVYGPESVPSAEAVQNSPYTVHFVAHHPLQLSPVRRITSDTYSAVYRHPSDGVGTFSLDFNMHPRPSESLAGEAQAAELRLDSEVSQAAINGQRRVRRLLGLRAGYNGAEYPVYFKSHRAAQLAAAATGGHVETVVYHPEVLARNLAHTAKWGASGRSDRYGTLFDIRSGSSRHPDYARLIRKREDNEASNRGESAPSVIASHPVLGEYITTVGPRPDAWWGRDLDWVREEDSHRGVMLHERSWQPDAEVARAYGDPPRHDHIAQLGPTAAQLHQQYLADPDDHLARAVLADHLEEIGQNDLADVFRASLPQQFSRRGEKTRLARAVAEHVRVKLAKTPAAEPSADSFGSISKMAKHVGKGSALAFLKDFDVSQPGAPGQADVHSASEVGNAPETMHFVGHHPRQRGVVGGTMLRNVLMVDHRDPTVELHVYDDTSIGPDGEYPQNDALNTGAVLRIGRGQQHVRSLVGLHDNSYEPVYFKSRLAAKVAAVITGGSHVNSVVYSPRQLAKFLNFSMPEHGGEPDLQDLRDGSPLRISDNRPEYARTPTVLGKHSSLGEYMTTIPTGAQQFPYLHDPLLVDPRNYAHSLHHIAHSERAAFEASRAKALSILQSEFGGDGVQFAPDEAAEAVRRHWLPLVQNSFPGDQNLRVGTYHVPSMGDLLALGEDARTLWDARDQVAARMALADLCEERGHPEHADFWHATLPQQFSRHGEKLRLSAAVAERVRVQLAKKPTQSLSADSFGTPAQLKAAGPGEYDNGRDVPFATLPPADEVRKSPHALHFVAHHPMQALPISYHWSGTSYPVIDPQSENYGRYVIRNDEAGHFDPVIEGQRSVRSLLGLKSDEQRPLTVFFKSYKGARLAALLTGGHVESIAMRPQSTGEMIDKSNRYLRRGGGAIVTPRSADRFYDQQIYDNRDKSMPALFDRNRAVLGSWDDLMNGVPVGSNSNVEPLILDKHEAFGEYLTQPHGGVAGGNVLWNRLSNHYGVPQSPHRSAILYHHGLIPVDGERREPTPESETAFHRLNREYPSAAHPLWHEGHSVPGQQVPITPEESAEMAREHWATLLEHASAERPLVLAGMQVPTRQHVEALGPDAQHLWALQRDPVARLALSDLLEERGHDEMAHFMRATVPLQYARKKRDAVNQPDSLAILEPEIGINVNDKSQAFTEQILSGDKTIETRSRATLHPYIGQRMGLVRTGKGKAQLVGYVTIGEPKLYTTSESFDADAGSHLVGADSPFHIARSKSGSKWGYQLLNAERIEPRPLVDGTGIPPNPRVARKLQRSSSLKSVVVQYASQKLRYAKDANPYRDGDRVDVIGIGSGNYRRESLTQPGRHEVDIYERGRMTHRATVSLDRITRTPAQHPPAPGPRRFSDPHDLQAGDVIRIVNDDGWPIEHSEAGGADRHDVHGYELVNQNGTDSPFATRHDPSVRVIPLGPRNVHRHPHIMGTRGRMFEIVRRGDGLPDRNHTYVDSYGHQFYVGDRVQVGVGTIPYTVLRNVVGADPHVILRSDSGRETRYAGHQDASGAYTIYGLHARRLGDWQPAPPGPLHNGVTETPPIQVAVRRGPTEPAFGAPPSPPPAPARQPVTTLERILNNRYPNAGAEQADKLREYFKRTYKKDVDDETIMHLLRVPRPFPGADPNHEVFDPKNIRLSFTIHGHGIGADASSSLLGYRFNTDTDISHDSVYNASQSHSGMRRSNGTFAKYISTPHILRNQALAAHSLGIPTLEVSAAQSNPTFPGCSTGGLVWPSYGYTALLMHKYNGDAVDQAVSIIKRHNPSRAADGHVSFWLHDLLASPEGRAWYNESTPTHNGKRYKNVTSGRMKFLTHPDSESHKLLLEHTRKVESYASQQRDSAGEDTGSSPPA